jgi:hypothetical protein
MDTNDLVDPFLGGDFFIKGLIIARAGIGGPGQFTRNRQPAVELLALDADQIAQHFIPAVNVIGHPMDFEGLQHFIRNRGGTIGDNCYLTHPILQND